MLSSMLFFDFVVHLFCNNVRRELENMKQAVDFNEVRDVSLHLVITTSACP